MSTEFNTIFDIYKKIMLEHAMTLYPIPAQYIILPSRIKIEATGYKVIKYDGSYYDYKIKDLLKNLLDALNGKCNMVGYSINFGKVNPAGYVLHLATFKPFVKIIQHDFT